MSETSVPPHSNPNSITNLELRVEYLKTRFDHTITHLHVTNKQIYLIDGAVLTFSYFLITGFGLTKSIALFLAVLSFILAGINFLHSRFILTQQHWYREIDIRIRKLLNEEDIKPIPKHNIYKNLFTSSHRNLHHIHILIVFWLIFLAIILILYAIGVIPEISIHNIKS
jgi:hypothetical protein